MRQAQGQDQQPGRNIEPGLIAQSRRGGRRRRLAPRLPKPPDTQPAVRLSVPHPGGVRVCDWKLPRITSPTRDIVLSYRKRKVIVKDNVYKRLNARSLGPSDHWR